MTFMFAFALALMVPTRSMVPTDLPAGPKCRLGGGWSVKHGCLTLPLVWEPRPCGSTREACVQTRDKSSGVQYTREVRSRSAFTQLTRAIATGEGKGWGGHLAHSVDALVTGAVSANSVSYALGESLHVSARNIRNEQRLVLSDIAKSMLDDNPQDFIRSYGLRFVSAIVEGGSYMGVATAWSTSSDTASALSAFAGLSYQDVFGVSGAFARAVREAGDKVESRSTSEFRGGTGVPIATTPEQIKEAHSIWSQSVRDDPVPVVMYTSRWIDVLEVNAIVMKKDRATRQLFQSAEISASMGNMLSYEYSHLNFVRASVRQALDWEKTPGDLTIRSKHDPSLCMLASGGLRPGSWIKLGRCTADDAQQFEWQPDATIRSTSNPILCFNAYGRRLKHGDPINLWTCAGASNERYYLSTDNTIRVASRPSMCLNAWGGPPTSQRPLDGRDIKLVAECTARVNEQFIHRVPEHASAKPLNSTSIAQQKVREFELLPSRRCEAGGVKRAGYSFDRCSSTCFANPDCSGFVWQSSGNVCLHMIGYFTAVCAVVPDDDWDLYQKKPIQNLLIDLNSEVQAQLLRVDNLNEYEVWDLQQMILKSDLSWFKADEFLRRFKVISFQKF